MARLFTQANARRLDLPGRVSREIVSAEDGADSVCVRLVEIAPEQDGDARRGPHVHFGFEECIHVVSGEGLTITESGDFPVGAGDTLLVPSGERHQTRNTGDAPLVLLCFFPVGDIRPGTREYPAWDLGKGAP